ncbi:MAG: ATPase [Fusobacteriaceae bacterium]
MGIESLLCNGDLKKTIKNELRNMKESGSYIFYGNDKKQLLNIALSLGKALNCDTYEDNFCDECESCKRMNSKTHGDLEILHDDNGIKIDAIRDLICKSASSSYEGKNKIFILEDVSKMKATSSNALLKTIEEPLKSNYFFLLSTSLNIIPTIKSRCTIIRVPQLSYEELGVSKDVFEFFNGYAEDIQEFKKKEIDLNPVINFKNIDVYLTEYYNGLCGIEEKIKVYSAIRYFIENIKWIDSIDKLIFIEGICRGAKDREHVFEILNYIGSLKGKTISVEKLLIAKNKLRLPVLLKGVLLDIFL